MSHAQDLKKDLLMSQAAVLRKISNRPPNCTEFAAHISTYQKDTTGLIDWSAAKLQQMIRTTTDNVARIELQQLLATYVDGLVAIAWDAGNRPLFIKTPERKSQK